jgi:hypothetical protein
MPLFRNHHVSLLIQLRTRLLQMDIVKSDRVHFRFQIQTAPLFRKHPVSPVIHLQARLLQKAITSKKDRLYNLLLNNTERSAIYHRLEELFQYMHDHYKHHYEAYYPGKQYRLAGLIGRPTFTNKNKLHFLRGL